MFDAFVIRARLKQILEMMERERRLVLDGAFDELATQAFRREAAMVALAESAPDSWERHEALIRRIRAGAERNHRMLEACVKGAKSADQRLREIAASHAQLGVYTPSGGRLAAPNVHAARERRF